MTALLVALLLAAPCDAPELRALPEAQQAAACRLQAAPSTGALDRQTLAPIYERPGFERARLRNTGALQALLAQLKRWFEGFAQTSGAQTYSNVTRILVLALALVLGGGVLLRFLTRRAPPPAPASEGRSATALQLDDPATHLARAEALLVAATPRDAIREGLLALLSSLERQRYARPDRVKTNRELAEELPTRGAPATLIAQVAPLFAWFDRTFYSLEPVASDEARRFLSDVRQLTERPA